jgi:nucleotide-binding universal stress UspA family protein
VQAYFGAVPSAVRVSCEGLHGPLADQLLTYAAGQEANLLLVGHRRSHPARWALARRLAMQAPCSVWLVPEGSPATLRRVLAPTDFSESAAGALAVATSLVWLSGQAECLALHVDAAEAGVVSGDEDSGVCGREEAFWRFVGAVDCHGVQVRPMFVHGANVALAIRRVARLQGVDLTVLAVRGQSHSAAIPLGSVTEDSIITTRVPLLVVKHGGIRSGVPQALPDKS